MLHKKVFLENQSFMILANFIFVLSHLKIQPTSCSFKYFKNSDVIVVKKKKLLKVSLF